MSESKDITGGAGYWDHRFASGDTPWDLGGASPPLRSYIDQLPDKHQSILIPGCGNGHEVEYLITLGFTRITVIDISAVLTQRLEQKFGSHPALRILTGDFFELEDRFDHILEQTFFCALDPSLRNAYAHKMHGLLHPRGRLAGVLFNRTFEAPGPPFGGSIAEYTQLFTPFFRIIKMEPCYNSVAPRAGSECFFILEKNSS